MVTQNDIYQIRITTTLEEFIRSKMILQPDLDTAIKVSRREKFIFLKKCLKRKDVINFKRQER